MSRACWIWQVKSNGAFWIQYSKNKLGLLKIQKIICINVTILLIKCKTSTLYSGATTYLFARVGSDHGILIWKICLSLRTTKISNPTKSWKGYQNKAPKYESIWWKFIFSRAIWVFDQFKKKRNRSLLLYSCKRKIKPHSTHPSLINNREDLNRISNKDGTAKKRLKYIHSK